MGLLAKSSGSGDGSFTLIDEGNYIARCIRVCDMGMQTSIYKGEANTSHKIMLMFEVPGETIVNKETGEIMPMMFSKEFTLSLNKKANLRPVLESLRGKAFTEEEATTGIDLGKIVGLPCSIQIFHKEGKDEKKYPNIGTISGMPKGSTCPPVAHSTFAYNIEDGRSDNFNALPEWIRTKIMKSSDWKDGVEDKAFEGISADEKKKMDNLAHPQEAPPPDDSDYNGNEIADEDLPF